MIGRALLIVVALVALVLIARGWHRPVPPPLAERAPVSHQQPQKPSSFSPEARPVPSVDRTTATVSDPRKPQWQEAYCDHFDDAGSIEQYTKLGGDVSWFKRDQALQIDSGPTNEGCVRINSSLPGDVRVRLRALPAKNTRDLTIGVFLSQHGTPELINGYFTEFEHGRAKIKRGGQLVASAPVTTPQTSDRWVAIEMQRCGGTITLTMEGRQILSWTDPQPFSDPANDQVLLYVFNDRTLIDDVVIERNVQDSIKSLPTEPVAPPTVTGGEREWTPPGADDF
jgi:hypothetical protein